MVDIQLRGPVFEGDARRAIEEWKNATGEELAGMGQAEIRRRALLMRRSAQPGHRWPGRVNTGAAARAVRVTQTPARSWKITGQSYAGEVWWPWLEGTSTRNESSRFKGYHTFRIVKNILQRRARTVAYEILQRFLPAMGGE